MSRATSGPSTYLRPDARLRVLWLHNVHCGPDPHAVMSSCNVVLCLSDWALQLARRFYPHVDPEKFARTRNGIDTSLYRREPRREGFQVVYSSSPDRGLDKLLDYWPAVRAARPGRGAARVNYGFDTWEKMIATTRDVVGDAQVQIFKTRLANMSGQGVVSQGARAAAIVAPRGRKRIWLRWRNLHGGNGPHVPDERLIDQFGTLLWVVIGVGIARVPSNRELVSYRDGMTGHVQGSEIHSGPAAPADLDTVLTIPSAGLKGSGPNESPRRPRSPSRYRRNRSR